MTASIGDFSQRPQFDPTSFAGKVTRAWSRAAGDMMWGMYRAHAWSIVTSDERAVGVGLAALRSGASAQAVADGLAEYVRLQDMRATLSAVERSALSLKGKEIKHVKED